MMKALSISLRDRCTNDVIKKFLHSFFIKIIIQKLWHLDFLYTYLAIHIRYIFMNKHIFEYSELYEFTSAQYERKHKVWIKLVMDVYFLPECKSGQLLFILFVTCRSSFKYT